MMRYAVKRLLGAVPILIGVSLLTFFVMHLAPGDPSAMFADPNLRPEELQRVKANWGLNEPVHIQYLYWLKNAVRGDLGTAYLINRPVSEVITERLPATFLLMGTAMLLTVLISVPLGVISAVRKGSLLDNAVTFVSFAGMSMPSFWLGLMLMMFFSLYLGWFPSTGISDPLLKDADLAARAIDTARHLFLPVLTLVIVSIAPMTRYVRASVLEVLKQNYIRAAIARGIPKRKVFFSHALRNALLPLITMLGMMLPELFGGAFITETIFGWPGMGRLGVTAVFSRNYPIIMGVVMVSAVLVIAGNILADILYSVADPRIKQSNEKNI